MIESALSPAFLDKAESLVTELESQSSVEIVVAVARSSGNYRDAQLWLALIITWVTLAVVILVPQDIPDLFLPPITAVAFLLGYWLAHRPPFKYLLVGGQRRRRQVSDAAALTFHKEHVSATAERTGILIYLSEEERDLEFLTDYAVDRVLPQATWNNLRQAILADPGQWTEKLITEMRKIQPLLNDKLPRRSDDKDELPNRPRLVRS